MMAPVRISYFTRRGDKLIQRMRQITDTFSIQYIHCVLCVCAFFSGVLRAFLRDVWVLMASLRSVWRPWKIFSEVSGVLKAYLRGVWRLGGVSQKCLASRGLYSETKCWRPRPGSNFEMASAFKCKGFCELRLNEIWRPASRDKLIHILCFTGFQ